MRDESDEHLMLRYQQGDAGAFDILYQRHKGPLYRYLTRLLAHDQTAEEIYQDVWLRLIQARSRYQASASFRTYLFQIARNRALDHFRSQRRRPQLATHDPADTDELPDAQQLDVADLVHNHSCLARLLELVRDLPDAQRDVFLLKEEAGLSLQEIAALSTENVEAVKSRLRYAIAKLRTGLREFLT